MSRLWSLAGLLALAALVALVLVPATLPPRGLSVSNPDEFANRVRAYLIANPEVIVDAMRVLESRRAAADSAQVQAALRQNKAVLRDPRGLSVAGNPKGDVTVVEFFDYRCPYCKQALAHVDKLLKDDKRIKLVLKEFPILGADSVFASKAAIAAAKQGRYLPFHNALMANKGALDAARVMAIAHEVGLDESRLRADMKAPEVEGLISESFALAQQLKVRGTPAFVIGDAVVRGYVEYPALQRLVEDARKSCKTC